VSPRRLRKWLKRRENALAVSFGSMSAQQSSESGEKIKRNDFDMLDHRFAVAPMMDWVESL
jgi:hypothetical protein